MTKGNFEGKVLSKICRKLHCNEEFYSIKACNMLNTLATDKTLIQEELFGKLLCCGAQFSVRTIGFGIIYFARKKTDNAVWKLCFLTKHWNRKFES